ncbi:MAG: cell wall-binding repeat-containing protein [Tissierellia bacterium]|nr:cell wall-binding repeat-containing protein [Tissierellia bacterium]
MKKISFLLVLCILATTVATAAPIRDRDIERISGANREQTAVQISTKSYSSSQVAILANGTQYVDALAASTLANILQAPILLSQRDGVDGGTKAELARLGVKQIYLLGGENTLSAKVEQQLESQGYQVQRIGGQDRYETSFKVYEEIVKHVEVFELLIAANEVDALASSPRRGAEIPLILVNRNHPSQAVIDLPFEKTVIGGEMQIDQELYQKLGASKRISGSNRFETAVKLAEGLPASQIFLVNAREMVDAFTASSLIHRSKGILLLSDSEEVEAFTREKIQRTPDAKIILVGGEKSLSDYVLTGKPASLEPVPRGTHISRNADGSLNINTDYFWGLSGYGTEWWFRPAESYYQGIKTTIDEDKQVLLNRYNSLWQAPSTGTKTVYLTFDEGYEYGSNTSKLLDTLKDKNVKATFFITGQFMDQSPELVIRMAQEGHLIGNHSVNHKRGSEVAQSSITAFIQDYDPLNAKYAALTGQKLSKYMRPPYGDYSERTLAILHELGYVPVQWSFGYHDWDVNDQPSYAQAIDQIIRQLHDGSILLLHTVSNTNVAIMPDLIDRIQTAGYQIETLDKIPLSSE